jgi:hypothetical protein
VTQKNSNAGMVEETETLAVAFADGTQEMLLAMFMAGWFKGVAAGEAKAKLALRQTFESPEPKDSELEQMRAALNKMQQDLDKFIGGKD